MEQLRYVELIATFLLLPFTMCQQFNGPSSAVSHSDGRAVQLHLTSGIYFRAALEESALCIGLMPVYHSVVISTKHKH